MGILRPMVGQMKCPNCQKPMRCVDTRPTIDRVYRRHECPEHGRFSTLEIVLDPTKKGKDVMRRAENKLEQDYKAAKLAWLNEQLEQLNG